MSIILVNKPVGITTLAAYHSIKRKLGKKVKIGHLGTLDPLASGLLVVLTHKDTKLHDQLMQLTKRYVFGVWLGHYTDTGDLDPRCEIKLGYKPTKSEIVNTVNKLQGYVNQTPPPASAKKVNGKPMYKLFRENPTLAKSLSALQNKLIYIQKVEIICWSENEPHFLIECSSGTFVRSVAIQLGGLATYIHRISIGDYWSYQARTYHI